MYTSLIQECTFLFLFCEHLYGHRFFFFQTSDVLPGLAVLVWIHGGSNEVGMGAMLRGDLLAARAKIIVVNLNYRLDALGKTIWKNKIVISSLDKKG